MRLIVLDELHLQGGAAGGDTPSPAADYRKPSGGKSAELEPNRTQSTEPTTPSPDRCTVRNASELLVTGPFC
ncbi:hypothetical protein ATANTOWER_011693 [Ataeniobius toweri]|uniref:Uncharacterized protein n=1 Tax=Ataeniobius toweri TaxID=208326 RepID=A0ABU7AP56_9TELE|nr:hypothetical protein [Ataeniobius toweri]